MTEDDLLVYNFIWAFKRALEGGKWEQAATLISSSLLQEFNEEELRNWTIAVIPAATWNKTILRFEPFVKAICRRLKMVNGFNIIQVKESHKPLKGKSSKSKIDYFSFKENDLPKKLFLFDDVINTGQTFYECATKLKSLGVKEIQGIMLGKAKRKHLGV